MCLPRHEHLSFLLHRFPWQLRHTSGVVVVTSRGLKIDCRNCDSRSRYCRESWSMTIVKDHELQALCLCWNSFNLCWRHAMKIPHVTSAVRKDNPPPDVDRVIYLPPTPPTQEDRASPRAMTIYRHRLRTHEDDSKKERKTKTDSIDARKIDGRVKDTHTGFQNNHG